MLWAGSIQRETRIDPIVKEVIKPKPYLAYVPSLYRPCTNNVDGLGRDQFGHTNELDAFSVQVLDINKEVLYLMMYPSYETQRRD